jgi:hypothetical protein
LTELDVLARAAPATGLRHVVWSTLEVTRPECRPPSSIRPSARVREINPALKSFDDWLSENASKFESN